MILATILFCNILFGILCIILATKQNRSAFVWFLLSIPFGIVTLFVLLFLQEQQAPRENISAKEPPPG